MMRCARLDQSTCTITLHYLSTGTLRLRLSIRKQEFMIPLIIILRALQPDCSERDVYAKMMSDEISGFSTAIGPQVEGARQCEWAISEEYLVWKHDFAACRFYARTICLCTPTQYFQPHCFARVHVC